jgi:hypothetical protein
VQSGRGYLGTVLTPSKCQPREYFESKKSKLSVRERQEDQGWRHVVSSAAFASVKVSNLGARVLTPFCKRGSRLEGGGVARFVTCRPLEVSSLGYSDVLGVARKVELCRVRDGATKDGCGVAQSWRSGDKGVHSSR